MSRIPQHEQPFDALVRQGLALLEEHRRTLGMQPGRTTGHEPQTGAGKSGLGDAVLDPGIRPLTPSPETLSGALPKCAESPVLLVQYQPTSCSSGGSCSQP